jgi:hypothetical protein
MCGTVTSRRLGWELLGPHYEAELSNEGERCNEGNKAIFYGWGVVSFSEATDSGAAGVTVAEFVWDRTVGEKPCELAPT